MQPTTVPFPSDLYFLCVDDHEGNLRMLSRVLTFYKYRFEAVRSGAAALALVDSGKRFDVGLIDIGMPVMDGLKLLQAFRNHSASDVRIMPCIAITAHAQDSDREKCLAAGFAGFIKKPVNALHLLPQVHNCLPIAPNLRT